MIAFQKVPKPVAPPDLKLHFKRMRRKLLEADMGKQGPDLRSGRALFLELEQFEPTVQDLEIAEPLIAVLVKLMKTSTFDPSRVYIHMTGAFCCC